MVRRLRGRLGRFGGRGGGFGLVGGLVGAADAGVEARLERWDEPVGSGVVERVAEFADGLLEVGEWCFECGESTDVDDAVGDGELVEVDELQGGGRRLGGNGGVGEHVGAGVAVLGDAGHEAGHLGERAVQCALGFGEIGGRLLQGCLGVGDVAVLQEFEPVEHAEVAVAGGVAGVAAGDPEPDDRNDRKCADCDRAPHDALAHVLAPTHVARDGDHAHGDGRDDR